MDGQPRLHDAGRPIQSSARTKQRLWVGLSVASGLRSLSGALVEINESGAEAQIRCLVESHRDLPSELTERYQRLLEGNRLASAESDTLASDLANHQAELISELRSDTMPRPLAVGVRDPGLWWIERGSQPLHTSLCASGKLAERTGLNVVDDFPTADLSREGQGGPVDTVALWRILRDESRSRVLLDLGRTARITYLPTHANLGDSATLLSFDVGPGTCLLDYLATRFSDGAFSFDPGGRLAVQGRKIADLIEHWLGDSYFQKPLPRWYPMGVQPHEELEASVQMAVDAGWSVRDLLCTATHFIAESIARAIRDHLPQVPPVNQLVLTGGGAKNGMLLSEIAARLPGVSLTRVDDLGYSQVALEAITAAVLAQMYADQMPANSPSITGTQAASVLGRVAPGVEQAWQALLQQMKAAPRRDAV